MSKSVKIPLKKAVWGILLSAVLISGSAFAFIKYRQMIQQSRLSQPHYNIVAIVQTTPDNERLKNFYFAELLNLSLDRPTNIFRLNADEAQSVLMASPIITAAHLKKIVPGTIHIDYCLRKPIAYLADYSNTVIDRDATPFPFKPFFTPKKLPEVYLGLTNENFSWGTPIKGLKSRLALYLIELINGSCCNQQTQLTRVDVSNLDADSNGQRQIIVTLEDRIKTSDGLIVVPQILRMSVNNYRQELANYLVLRERLINQGSGPLIIDLRISELAYVTGVKNKKV